MLSTDKGREAFWCERSSESENQILFLFPNGTEYNAAIHERIEGKLFKLNYFNSLVTFEIDENADGSSDVTLTNTHVAEDEYDEVNAGWVSVLMNLKAVTDHGVDLRNHHKLKTWDHGYVDN